MVVLYVCYRAARSPWRTLSRLEGIANSCDHEMESNLCIRENCVYILMQDGSKQNHVACPIRVVCIRNRPARSPLPVWRTLSVWRPARSEISVAVFVKWNQKRVWCSPEDVFYPHAHH